jgi:hypothetical protein
MLPYKTYLPNALCRYDSVDAFETGTLSWMIPWVRYNDKAALESKDVRTEKRSKKREAATPLAWKMEEGSMSQGIQTASRNYKG